MLNDCEPAKRHFEWKRSAPDEGVSDTAKRPKVFQAPKFAIYYLPLLQPSESSTSGSLNLDQKLINYEPLSELQKRLLNSQAASQWKRIGINHHHGVAVPLFSLRSSQSGGVGEYTGMNIPFTDQIIF